MIGDAIRSWIDTRNAREQRVLRIAVWLVPLLVVLAVVLPLHRTVRGLEQRIAAKQQDLAFLQGAVPQLAAAGVAMPAPVAGNVAETVTRTLSETGLAPSATGTQAVGEGLIKVQFDKAPFNGLLAWSKRLSGQQALRIEAASLKATGEPGLVSGSITLRDAH